LAKYDIIILQASGKCPSISVDDEYIPNFSPLDFEYADTMIADATGQGCWLRAVKNLIGISKLEIVPLDITMAK